MNVSSPLRPILAVSFLLLHATFVTAQEPSPAFSERMVSVLAAPQFTDREVVQLTSTLDSLLGSAGSAVEFRAALWNYGRQLQAGRLTKPQETRILKHLDEIARTNRPHAAIIGGARRMISELTLGKTAPEILGRDLDGLPLRLSDYRGKVVVLMFSAEWCGICRTQHPYERMMLELYRNWPFALVSVETGSSPEATKRTKSREELNYRSWWDGPSDEGEGPIASAWNVGGFPTTYVIDGRGVIRFVDLRYEDLLKGVRQLLAQQAVEAEVAERAGSKSPENAARTVN